MATNGIVVNDEGRATAKTFAEKLRWLARILLQVGEVVRDYRRSRSEQNAVAVHTAILSATENCASITVWTKDEVKAHTADMLGGRFLETLERLNSLGETLDSLIDHPADAVYLPTTRTLEDMLLVTADRLRTYAKVYSSPAIEAALLQEKLDLDDAFEKALESVEFEVEKVLNYSVGMEADTAYEEPVALATLKPVAHATVPVFYATDRNVVQNANSSLASFSNGRGRHGLTFGVAEVSIPTKHKPGRMERPFQIFGIEFSENPDKHIVIKTSRIAEASDWGKEAKEKLAARDSRSALVFIHGFNVSFDDAIRRAAQLGKDLEFEGLVTAYSWSSEYAVSGYAADEDNVRLTVPFLRDFLVMLHTLGASTIHIIAHSMGNRALVEALEGLAVPPNAGFLGEVVMAAPDIDARLLERAVSGLKGKAKRYTLYGSEKDSALALSKKLRKGYVRAGDGGRNVFVAAEIETVDATKAGKEMFGLGHSYFAKRRRVIADLYYLIRESLPASRRNGLLPRTIRALPYWLMD